MAETETGKELNKEELIAEVKQHLHSGALQLPLRIEGWHKSLTDGGHLIRHSSGRTLATVEFVPVENETGRPALDGNAPARAMVAVLNAAPTLLADFEQLTRLRSEIEEAREVIEGLQTFWIDQGDETPAEWHWCDPNADCSDECQRARALFDLLAQRNTGGK